MVDQLLVDVIFYPDIRGLRHTTIFDVEIRCDIRDCFKSIVMKIKLVNISYRGVYLRLQHKIHEDRYGNSKDK